MAKVIKFKNKEEEFKYLFENRQTIKAQRRAEPKKSDSFGFVSFAIDERGERLKADNQEENSATLKVRCIINTTGILDSHRDLHIPGIWKKSLQEKAMFYLLQEHDFTFKGIITDNVKAYTKSYDWKELGFDFAGTTEALVFDCILEKERNEYMFDQYQKGYVKNHSVRMQYVKEYFCMNSTDPSYTQQKENWDKYIQYCVNVADAELHGYFYAVTEAKAIEGSAVVRGSNFATPTLEIPEGQKNENINQAEKSLENTEPPMSTQTERKKVFIN